MSNVHVYPVDDLIEHELRGDDCPCGPLVEPVERDDGSFGWVLTHHSLDGREHRSPNRLTQNLGLCALAFAGWTQALGIIWHSWVIVAAGSALWLVGCFRLRREIDNRRRQTWECMKVR